MDNTAQMAVCYLPIRTIPPFISEYVKSQRLNQMQTLLASLGIAMRDVYVDEGFEQAPADKPGLKMCIRDRVQCDLCFREELRRFLCQAFEKNRIRVRLCEGFDFLLCFIKHVLGDFTAF